MRPPDFWRQDGPLARLLDPLGRLYGIVDRWKRGRVVPWRAPVPVICVGNIALGGTGKTPTAIDLAERLVRLGQRPHLLTRGYGGRERGPLLVDPARHTARDVGDEPLLLAAAAPTWVARDRVAGAKAATAAGATCLVLDDGLQNPGLVHDLRLAVVDGGAGFGNGRVFPAGPLREAPATGLGSVARVIVIGPDRHGIGALVPTGVPVLAAELVADHGAATALKGQRVFAFAGIGRPDKLFGSLAQAGAIIVQKAAFADHHPYRDHEIAAILDACREQNLVPVTTTKDHVRLPAALQSRVETLPVTLRWQDEAVVDSLLAGLFQEGPARR